MEHGAQKVLITTVYLDTDVVRGTQRRFPSNICNICFSEQIFNKENIIDCNNINRWSDFARRKNSYLWHLSNHLIFYVISHIHCIQQCFIILQLTCFVKLKAIKMDRITTGQFSVNSKTENEFYETDKNT